MAVDIVNALKPLAGPPATHQKKRKNGSDADPLSEKKPKEPVYVLAGARGKRQRSEAAATFGLENFIGHDLRRTAASMMAAGGVSRGSSSAAC